jgi:coproporphyrinogen III oxidase-like Fe-S oxidoreductase
VDKDMDETIIIEMAAENPPKNTKTVRALLSKKLWINRIGICIQTFSFKRMLPQAIGKTKILK